jgi:hypothetical protein
VGKVDLWLLAGRVLKSVESLLPGSVLEWCPRKYPLCNCYGLERFAMLRYDIDDIRKLEAASVP